MLDKSQQMCYNISTKMERTRQIEKRFLLKIFNKVTDNLKKVVIIKGRKNYRNYLYNNVDHKTEYAFGKIL